MEPAVVAFSFQKGIRRHYGLGLCLAGGRLVVIPNGESAPVEVDADRREKYSPACLVKGGTGPGDSKLSLSFSGQRDRDALELRLESGSKLVGVADGFDRYPFASLCGPALFFLVHGPSPWRLTDVLPHMVALVERTGTQAAFTGVERLFVDACRVGLGDEAETLIPVLEERRTWLRAIAASANARHDDALRLCGALPEGRCPERNLVVAAALQAGVKMGEAESLDGSSVAGKVLAHLFTGRPIERGELRTGATAIGTWIADPAARRSAVDGLGNVDSKPLALPGMSVLEKFEPYRVVSALLDRSGGTAAGLELSSETIKTLPLTVVDELIEQGIFSGSGRQAYLESSRTTDSGYLVLRLDPKAATDAQLSAPGGEIEKSRRHVVECLAGRTEPTSGSAVTMVALRSGRPVSSDAINALPVEWRASARELSEFLVTGDLDLAEELAKDPTVLPVIAERLAGESQSLPRTGRLADLRAKGHLEDALRGLLEARWQEALSSAREVLGCTAREDLRDEALNLLACAQWQLGDDERAIGALREALEGEYNLSLQTNIGVVAANLEPSTAAEYLAQLAVEAPTVGLRYSAAMRGLSLWKADRDDEDDSPLPPLLRDALRSLTQTTSGSTNLSDSEFWSLLFSMASHDSDWLRANMAVSTAGSRRLGAPTGGAGDRTVRAQMVDVALALGEGVDEFVEALGALTGPDSSWRTEQRDFAVALVMRFKPVHLEQCQEVAQKFYEQVGGVPRWRLNKEVVRRAVNPLRALVQDSIRVINKVKPWTDDPFKIEVLEKLLEWAQGLDSALGDLVR